jgi:1,4-dihydroxy-2-naphthoate octaprenyltransferase
MDECMTEPSEIVLPEERSRPIRFIKILLFSASIMPAIVASALAHVDGYSNLSWSLLAGLGLLIGQAGADYLYYHFTHYHTDSRDAHTRIFAGWKPLFIGSLLKKEQSLNPGLVCLFAALIIGIYFFLHLGADVLWLILAGGLVSIFFTPLMLRGLKEPVVFITFGPLCMSGIDLVLTRQFRLAPIMASLPVGFLVTVVAYLKGARYKIVEESGSQVILNLNPRLAGILLLLAYLALVGAAVSGFIPIWALLGLLTVPFSALLYRRLQNQKRIGDYLWATVYALVVFIATCLLMALGMILSTLI